MGVQSEVARGRGWSSSLSHPISTLWMAFLACVPDHPSLCLGPLTGRSQEEKQRSYRTTQASQQAFKQPSGMLLLPLCTRGILGNVKILGILQVAYLFW